MHPMPMSYCIFLPEIGSAIIECVRNVPGQRQLEHRPGLTRDGRDWFGVRRIDQPMRVRCEALHWQVAMHDTFRVEFVPHGPEKTAPAT